MQELCRLDDGKAFYKQQYNQRFQPFKVAIEVVKGTIKEAHVKVISYGSERAYIRVECGEVCLDTRNLKVGTKNSTSATELFLNLEVCKFVLDENAELFRSFNNV